MSSYLVTARKWRPGLFEEIVGQEHVTRTLRNAVASDRIAHAYLFSGPRGVGKTTAARILAKGLNCEAGPTPTPCNDCSSCKSIASGSSVDVFEIDGASNTSVDNVRELRESVRYVPTRGKYKVYIIDEVHMLSTSAFNALLKTLEEPPPHAVFIFATTEVHKIPLTILSRCQRFDFKRIPLKEIFARLEEIVDEEGIGYDEGALLAIAREADGSLRDAQSLLDQVIAYSGEKVSEADVTDSLGLMDRTVLVDLLGMVVAGKGGECLNIVEKIYDFGYDLKRACSDLLEYIRDLTVLKVSGPGALAELPDGELRRLEEISSGVEAERLHVLFNVISTAYGEVSRSSFPRYSFEMAVLRAAQTTDLRPVGELIARLEGLARSFGPGRPDSRPRQGGGSVPTAPAGPPARKAGEGGAQSSERPERHGRPDRGGADPGPAGQGKSGAGDCAGEYGDGTLPGPVSAASEEAVDYGGAGNGGFVAFALARGANPALKENLSEADVVVDGNVLRITVDGGLINFFNMMKDRVESLFREFLGRPGKVEISAAPAAAGAERKKAAADPLITEAVRLFDGRVIEDRRRQNVQ